jgi:hypothetical protein
MFFAIGCGPSRGLPLIGDIQPLNLAVDDDAIYWNDWSFLIDSTIMSAPKAPTGATVIRPLGSGNKPLVVDHVVYSMVDGPWDGNNQTALHRYLPGGIEQVSLLRGVGGDQIAAEGSTVFLALQSRPPTFFAQPWTSTIWAQPLDGRPATPLATDPGEVEEIRTSAGEIFWVSFRDRVSANPEVGVAIMKVSARGGEPTTIATHESPSWARLAVDPGGVYWSLPSGKIAAPSRSGTCPRETLYRLDRLTNETKALATVGVVRSIASDGTSIFWADDCRDDSTGVLHRLSLESGQIEDLARVDSVAGGTVGTDRRVEIALDEQHVYWAVWGTPGGIFRLRKDGTP